MEELFCALLCGVPGVGKTTYVNAKVEQYKKDGYKVISWSDLRQLPYTGNERTVAVINYDDIHSAFVKMYNSSEAYVVRKILNEFGYCFHYCIEKGVSAIIDSTNTEKAQRYKKLRTFSNFKKICWCLTDDATEISRRNVGREKVVPEEYMREYFRTFEMPDYDENFDEIWINDKLLPKPESVEIDDEEL